MKNNKTLLTVKISVLCYFSTVQCLPWNSSICLWPGITKMKLFIQPVYHQDRSLLRLSRGMTPSCSCYERQQDWKILPGNGHLDLATIVVALFFIKDDSKMEYFSLCHKLDMVIRLSAIKSVQYVSSQQDTEDVFLICGHRETMRKRVFALLGFHFCEMFHGVEWRGRWQGQKSKRNICLLKVRLWKQEFIVLPVAHQIWATRMQREKDWQRAQWGREMTREGWRDWQERRDRIENRDRYREKRKEEEELTCGPGKPCCPGGPGSPCGPCI